MDRMNEICPPGNDSVESRVFVFLMGTTTEQNSVTNIKSFRKHTQKF